MLRFFLLAFASQIFAQPNANVLPNAHTTTTTVEAVPVSTGPYGSFYGLPLPVIPTLPNEVIPKGEKPMQPICDPSYSNAALIIIDMQPFFSKRGVNAGSKENKAKVEKILKAQVDAIHAAKKAGLPIVVVEYSSNDIRLSGGDEDEDVITAQPIVSAIGNYPTTKFVTKTSDGLFDVMNLDVKQFEEYSRSKRLGTLIIIGANGGACVQRTIAGALFHNCNVVAYSKGIADFNFPEFIYPYKYDGTFQKPNFKCTNCTFLEVDELNKLQYSMKFSGDAQISSTQGGSDVSH